MIPKRLLAALEHIVENDFPGTTFEWRGDLGRLVAEKNDGSAPYEIGDALEQAMAESIACMLNAVPHLLAVARQEQQHAEAEAEAEALGYQRTGHEAEELRASMESLAHREEPRAAGEMKHLRAELQDARTEIARLAAAVAEREQELERLRKLSLLAKNVAGAVIRGIAAKL